MRTNDSENGARKCVAREGDLESVTLSCYSPAQVKLTAQGPIMNAKPIGTIVIKTRFIRCVAGEKIAREQRFIKVSHHGPYRRRWIPFARHVWQQANGRPVPDNCQVFFRDHNSLNDSIENLVLVRRNHLQDVLAIYPEVARTFYDKQRAAVRRSNRKRWDEGWATRDAILQPESWYAVLHGLQLIFWKPFSNRLRAERTCTARFLTESLSRDGIQFSGSIEILTGAELSLQCRPDGFLEAFRRYVPDERKPSKRDREAISRELID